MTRQFGLSKSRIAAFEQCPRRLWLQVHRPELAEYGEAAQMAFVGGHDVGVTACALYPDGVMVEAEPDMAAAISRTQELIAAADRPIFEATFVHDGVLVRADMMLPDETKQGWHVAEVKSATAPKGVYHGDLATQLWVLEGCGVQVTRASIRHIDTSFVLTHLGDYAGLFVDASLDEAVTPIKAGRGAVVASARAMLAGDEPDQPVGPHCNIPYPCEFQNWCGRGEPPAPDWPIHLLPYSGAKLAVRWGAEGAFDLRDLPSDAALSPLHERIRAATVSGESFIDRLGVQKAIRNWTFPRIWLDFETIAFAVPRWIGTRPYAATPFQFSAHIEAKDGTLEHVEWLALDQAHPDADPRPGIAGALAALPSEGSVVAWNMSFEKRCLLDLAKAVPEHAKALTSLSHRLVDLLPVTKAHYYHRAQRGSWSIKAVLPTLRPDLNYSTLAVKDGGNAQAAFIEAISPDCAPESRSAIVEALKAYCERDTYAMVAILRGMLGEVGM
jgi:hypothetical protein